MSILFPFSNKKYKKIHIASIGNFDHGKSSIIGRLFWDLNKISDKTKKYLEELSPERKYAYVMDQMREEQGRGITINVGHKKLLVDNLSITFSDAPGHEIFLEKAQKAIDESRAVLLVIAADEGITEQTKGHLDYARRRGISDFIVAINKMDLVNYEKNRFTDLREELISLFIGSFAHSPIIPTSAIKGDNIVTKSENMDWYRGSTFLEAIKQLKGEGDAIEKLINESKEITMKGVEEFKNPVILWAGGKDSTTQISLAREIYGKLPFPVMFIDTTWKFSETYQFIEKYSKEWDLDLIRVTNREAIERGVNPWSVSHFEYCNELKTKPLLKAIKDYGFDAVFVAIRWDEHGIRGKETYFSKRESPPHTRIHSMLNWSEREIWQYLKSRNIPYNPIYDKEENGLVYRSIGCWPFTKPVPKDTPDEREGRELDKERLMEHLRSLGYM